MYTSRLLGVGLYGESILASFTLASKSIPFRELRINLIKNKVNVFPRQGYESHYSNLDPEIDNYSCMRAGKLPNGEEYIAAFNGHMCKRVEANLRDGLNPLMALDLTLLDFRGASNDARIGGISMRRHSGEAELFLAVNDTGRGEKRICRYPNERVECIEDKVIFVYDKDTRLENVFDLKEKRLPAQKLAEYIHHNVVGEEIEFGIATAVALAKDGKFEFGVYNCPLNSQIIEKWSTERQASLR